MGLLCVGLGIFLNIDYNAEPSFPVHSKLASPKHLHWLWYWIFSLSTWSDFLLSSLPTYVPPSTPWPNFISSVLHFPDYIINFIFRTTDFRSSKMDSGTCAFVNVCTYSSAKHNSLYIVGTRWILSKTDSELMSVGNSQSLFYLRLNLKWE